MVMGNMNFTLTRKIFGNDFYGRLNNSQISGVNRYANSVLANSNQTGQASSSGGTTTQTQINEENLRKQEELAVDISNLESLNEEVQQHIDTAQASDNYTDWYGHYGDALDKLAQMRVDTIKLANETGISLSTDAIDLLSDEIRALIANDPFPEIPEAVVTSESNSTTTNTNEVVDAPDLALVEKVINYVSNEI